jgi:farnesyl-diphosphate farnesyltransferase
MQKYAQSSRRLKFSFLQNMQELDEYMYYVAGTVGYLLTELFSHYSIKITPLLKKRLELLAGSFGKGLQLVNIIRDMSGDLRRGQSYIPDELLFKYKLTRQSVFDGHNQSLAIQMFEELIERALAYLDKAVDYILLIPKNEGRIRLFCILPVFWAMRTLQKIRENTLALLNPEKVKIPRSVIRREYYMALLNLNSNRLIRYRYEKIRAAIAVGGLRPALA